LISQHKLLAEALRLGFGTAKEMAAAGGISVQSAIRYRRGETYPDVFTIARLMRQSRIVAEAVLRMAGLDDVWLDQEQARLLRELIDLQQRRAPHVAAAMAAAENAMAGSQAASARPRGTAPAAAVAARSR
jgi:hypothetical protein